MKILNTNSLQLLFTRVSGKRNIYQAVVISFDKDTSTVLLAEYPHRNVYVVCEIENKSTPKSGDILEIDGDSGICEVCSLPICESSATEPNRTNSISSNVIYKHIKRGTLYEIIGTAKLQLDGEHDMSDMVIYRDLSDLSSTWTRKQSEFFDGRFVQINT